MQAVLPGSAMCAEGVGRLEYESRAVMDAPGKGTRECGEIGEAALQITKELPPKREGINDELEAKRVSCSAFWVLCHYIGNGSWPHEMCLC
jgi:hypothetical protein